MRSLKFLTIEIIDHLESVFRESLETKNDKKCTKAIKKQSVESEDGNNTGEKMFKHNLIITKMIGMLLKIIQHQDTEDPENSHNIKTSVTAATIFLGKEIVRLHIVNLFKKQDKYKSLSAFRESLEEEPKFIWMFGDLYSSFLGGKIFDVLLDEGLITITIIVKDDKKHNFFIIKDDILNQFKNQTLTPPMKLPMIVKPRKHTKNTLGGYLSNDTIFIDKLISSKPTSKIKSEIQKDNCIYNVINGLSSNPFKVNKGVLTYLEHNGAQFFLEDKEINKLDNKKKFEKWNWRDKVNYRALLSVRVLKENIMSLASTYKNIPKFYFPMKLDYRGRVYIIPHYFNYQSHELAKSLLLFAEPGILRRSDTKAIEYYKVMASNYFGHGIDKLSFNNKLEWFKDNEENIINYENNILLSKADKKYLFLAFCIEYKSFFKFMLSDINEEFNTYLPIQLDAACNGYQHLSLLAQEKSIYNTLNLGGTSKDQTPKDFYNYICTEIIYNIKQLVYKKDYKDIGEKASY